MKKIYMVLFILSFFCVTVFGNGKQDNGNNGGAITLDHAILAAVHRLETTLESGTVVAVLNFVSNSSDLSDYVVEELMNTIVEGKILKVVDRTKLDVIRNEIQFQMSGEVSDETMQEVGRMLGAQEIIAGQATDFGDILRVRIFSINVESAERRASFATDIIKDNRVLALLDNNARNQNPKNSIQNIAGNQNLKNNQPQQLGRNKEIAYDDGISNQSVAPMTNEKDAAVAVLFTISEQIILKKIKVYITNNAQPITPFRIKLLSVRENGMPGNSILSDEIIASANRGNEWVITDVEKYHVIVNKDFFVSVEWITPVGTDGKNAQFIGYSFQNPTDRSWVFFNRNENDWILHKSRGGNSRDGNFLIRIEY
jgi:hypothetical protein